MNKIIKDIIDSQQANGEKLKILNSLRDDAKKAINIISENYKYCEECDDYYLPNSFIRSKETKEIEICVYQDYINSGNSDYEKRYIDVIYRVCPKGHKHEIGRSSPRR